MRFLDARSTTQWRVENGWNSLSLPPSRLTVSGEANVAFGNAAYVVASVVVLGLPPSKEILLEVTGWGIWPSSENRHLFARLRASYCEVRSIEQAPGHVFYPAEEPDLISFMQLAIQNGWDAELLTAERQHRVAISHDGWTEIGAWNIDTLANIRAGLERVSGLRIRGC